MSGLRKTDPVRIAQRHQREVDAAAAMAEYRAASAAEIEKATRLRALRLAKEAATSKTEPASTKKPKRTTKS